MADNYRPGSWKAVCDRCGLETMGPDLVDDIYQPGLKVHRWCQDTRNPQDFIRPRVENIVPPFIRTDANNDPTIITSTPYTIDATEDLWSYIFNCTGGNIAVTLPTYNNSNFNKSVVCYSIQRADDGTSNTLTVSSASPIYGSALVRSGGLALYQNGASGWTRIA